MDAEGWLRDERTMIASGDWIPPKGRAAAALAAQPPTLSEYSASWLDSRTLRPRTRAHYAQLLDRNILPRSRRVPADRDLSPGRAELARGARPDDTDLSGPRVFAAAHDHGHCSERAAGHDQPVRDPWRE